MPEEFQNAMKQPGLGKKIAELRTAKGLTQSELASACNLSLRTVQRIESAEVEPRSFTVRLLFSHLGAEAYTEPELSEKIPLSIIGKNVRNSMQNVFNFKTHTMKKITLLSLTALSMIAVPLISGWNSTDNEKAAADIARSNRKLTEWFNAGKIDSVATLYSENCYIMPAGSPALSGRAQVTEYYNLLSKAGYRFIGTKSQTLDISGNTAVERGNWTGNLNGEHSGSYLTHWKKRDGKWTIENDATTLDTPIKP